MKEQLEAVNVFVEKQTAKIPGRPVFGEMIERMEKVKHRYFWRGILIDCFATVDGGKIIYLVDTGVISEISNFFI
ncbi:MAG: hypothetical protein U0517_02545 [Candidatus Andersenbacteria bacterium]